MAFADPPPLANAKALRDLDALVLGKQSSDAVENLFFLQRVANYQTMLRHSRHVFPPNKTPFDGSKSPCRFSLRFHWCQLLARQFGIAALSLNAA